MVILFQGLHQDAFQPAHVDEVHCQGPTTGGVQTLRRVTLAQTQQLVSLPDLGPGQGAVEETLGKFSPPPVPVSPRCAGCGPALWWCMQKARRGNRRDRWSGHPWAGGGGS